jgi:hypothetical protein
MNDSSPNVKRPSNLPRWRVRILGRTVALALVLIVLAATATITAAIRVAGAHDIQHVVVIMMENRSFDSYFGTFPGADGRPDSRPDVRESSPLLGDLMRDFDFSQSPRAPLILPQYPYPSSSNPSTITSSTTFTVTSTLTSYQVDLATLALAVTISVIVGLAAGILLVRRRTYQKT